MARSLSLSLTLVTALALLGGCDRESGDDTQQEEAPPESQFAEASEVVNRDFAGDAIPEFTFTDVEGNTLELASLKGQPVLLNLWATWCVPCVVEMPMLDAIAEEYDGRLRVVTVSMDSKGAEEVVPFFAEHGFANLETWLYSKADLSITLRAPGLPTTVLYGSDGEEVARVFGDFDWEGEDATALIEEAIDS
jgi:thiol-disulfide isomerase/thioredoxin